MTVYIAFLRAINVGGTGMLPMKDLAALCTDLGLKDVRTYIQSGNVVFKSTLSEGRVKPSSSRRSPRRWARRSTSWFGPPPS